MTTTAMSMARGHTWTLLAIGAGLLVGLAYTLSPLTVLSLVVLIWAMVAASRGLSESEHRWFWSLMSVAVLVRVVAVALLFSFADATHPFASFFGDEELYKFRSVWLRNLGQSIPIAPSDVIYSDDPVGRTGYMYVLAFIQAIVGDAPYGLHMLSIVLYLCGVLALYRWIRAAFGRAVAMAGFIVLLFLPSLGLWSISVLKEPMNVFMLAGELMCAVSIVRAPKWWQKALAGVGVIAFGMAMESLRGGGLITAVAGTIGGLMLALVLSRGRRLLFALVAAPIAIALLASMPAVQDRVLTNLRIGAFQHAGHVVTPGYTYQLIDRGYYESRVWALNHLPPPDAGRYAIKAVWSYFSEPLPWKTESHLLLAYLPEQFAWYVMVLLVPIGVVAGMRRDAVITSMLVAHTAAAIVLVALTSGNIGTLIRHRSLAVLYLVWLAALGGHEGVRRCLGVREEGSCVDGDR